MVNPEPFGPEPKPPGPKPEGEDKLPFPPVNPVPDRHEESFPWSRWAVWVAVAVIVIAFAGSAWWEMKQRSASIREYERRQINIANDVKWIKRKLSEPKN